MVLLEKQYINALYDRYGVLLTERQQQLFTLYHMDDLSLSEIADRYDISRQAVKDTIDKAMATLEKMERALHIVQKISIISAMKDADIDNIIKLLEE